ncbi:MAG: hypothetical protein KDD50_14700 [Bdellovibrionales bacterium]|nr:hypothetical protein [Bdellovibrionales bacterium]
MSKKILMIIPITFLFLACSNVYRSVDHSYSEEEVLQIMNEQVGAAKFVSSASSDQQNSLYFAISGPDFGLPKNILAMNNLDFISSGLDVETLQEASVFFMESVGVDSRTSEIRFYVKDENGATHTQSFSQVDSYIEPHTSSLGQNLDRFVFVMSGGGGTIYLSTHDLVPGKEELSSTIQFDVEYSDGSYLGRISALSGFVGF